MDFQLGERASQETAGRLEMRRALIWTSWLKCCTSRIGFIRDFDCVNAAMLALYFLVSYISEGGAIGFWTGVTASEHQSGTQGTKARRKPIAVRLGFFFYWNTLHPLEPGRVLQFQRAAMHV